MAGLFYALLTNQKNVHIFAARSKLAKMEKRTIGQAAELYGLEKRTFQKRLKTALNSPKKRAIFAQFFPEKAPENVGLGDPFTDELRGFWEMWTDGKTDTLPKTDLAKTEKRIAEKPRQSGKGAGYAELVRLSELDSPPFFSSTGELNKPENQEIEPDDRVRAFELATVAAEMLRQEGHRAPSIGQSPPIKVKSVEFIKGACDPSLCPDFLFSDVPEMPEPPVSKPEPKPDVQKVDVIEVVFGSKKIVLIALSVLIFSDGFSMSILAGRTFPDNPLAYFLFSIVGVIIGYAAISTARASSFATTRMWESSNAGWWIAAFSVFQTALHGAAFELFSELEKLTTNEIIGRVLICISISLSTASLTSIILKR